MLVAPSLKVALVLIPVVAGGVAWYVLSRDADAPAPVVTVPARQASAPIEMPPVNFERAAAAFQRAREAGEENPGAAAFRSYTDEFVDWNPDATAEHMAAEGLTIEEARELTYFALVARKTMEWELVEGLLGARVSREARKRATDAMLMHSEEMKMVVRDHVAAGDPPSVRMRSILAVEQSYLDEYFRITGMTPALLDLLLKMAVMPDAVALRDPGPPLDEPEEPAADPREYEIQPGWKAVDLSSAEVDKLRANTKK